MFVCLFSEAKARNQDNFAIVCNSCSYTELSQLAEANYNASNHSGNYLLINYESGNIYKLRMMYEPEIGQALPIGVAISSTEQAEFEIQQQAYDLYRYALYQTYLSNLSYGAYELKGDKYATDEIISDYKYTANVNRQLRNLNVSIIKLAFQGFSVDFGGSKIEIKLADGGSAFIKYSGLFLSGTVSPQYELVNIVDKDGNEIPDSDLKDAKLTFRFTDLDNFNVFMDYMEQNFNIGRDEIEVTYIKRIGNPKKPVTTIIGLENGNATLQPPADDSEFKEDP
jgi:hypothetical protein